MKPDISLVAWNATTGGEGEALLFLSSMRFVGDRMSVDKNRAAFERRSEKRKRAGRAERAIGRGRLFGSFLAHTKRDILSSTPLTIKTKVPIAAAKFLSLNTASTYSSNVLPFHLMNSSDFHLKLAEAAKAAGKPNFVIYGWYDEENKLKVSWAFHEMKAKAVVLGATEAIQMITEKNL